MSQTKRDLMLERLGDQIELIRLSEKPGFSGFSGCSDTPEEITAEALAHATKLAHELFPPMAKPLQWLGSRSGDYRVFEIEPSAHVPQIRNMCGHVPRYDPIGDACATQDEARAACESHHQQTFKDQLA